MLRPATELALVSITALLFLGLPKPPEPIEPLAVFIGSCVVVWGGYLLGQWRRRREDWGLDPRKNLGLLLRALALPSAMLVAGGAGYAISEGHALVPRYLWVALLLYPVWGFVQQWLVQCLFVDNLRKFAELGRGWLVLIGAIGFGLLHVEDPTLWAATTAMGGLYTALFQRYRNLWPLAVLHGWLGSLFYPWVLNENPLADIIDTLLGSSSELGVHSLGQAIAEGIGSLLFGA